MAIQISKAEIADMPFILSSVAEVNRKSGILKPPYLTMETLRKDVFCSNPATSINVAFYKDTPVGFVMYSPIYFTSLGRAIWVTQLFTQSQYRQQGIATQLLEYVKAQNPQANAFCWVTTSDNKDAQLAFDKMTTEKINGVAFYVMRTA